jgi:hypothetical protein
LALGAKYSRADSIANDYSKAEAETEYPQEVAALFVRVIDSNASCFFQVGYLTRETKLTPKRR